MKLKVLYAEDGRIVSLSWMREPEQQDSPAAPMLRSGAEPGKGQRFAVVEADASLHGCRLAEIHSRFTVVHHGEEIRLVERRG